jgi:Pectate lyase superfamily protein
MNKMKGKGVQEPDSAKDVQVLSGTNIKWVDTSLGTTPQPQCSGQRHLRNGDLATMTSSDLGAHVVIAKGCVTPGDNGGGLFYWTSSITEPDNGGTVIAPKLPLCNNPPPPNNGRWIRIYDGPVDVRWFGARGDGSTDDTIAIQLALDHVRIKGGTLYLPPGRYIITSTLDAGASQGVRYIGSCSASRSNNFADDGALKMWPTTLVWQGGTSATDVLFKWGGSHCIFDGIGFQGGFEGDTRPPGIAFLLYKTAGLGSGKGSFPRIQITHAQVAFQCNEASGENANCDTLDFGRFQVRDCDVGFRCLQSQCIGYHFQYAKFDDIDTCWDFQAGGILTVDHMHSVRTPLVLHIPGAGLTSAFRFGFIDFDAAQNVRVVWVKHTATAGQDLCYVTIEGGFGDTMQNQGGSSEAAFQMGPRSVLRVRNVTGGMTHGTQSSGARSPLLKQTGTSRRYCSAIFESCGLDDTDPGGADATTWYQVAGSRGGRRRVLRDCWRTSHHNPVSDIDVTE